jgi:hypothetical protein
MRTVIAVKSTHRIILSSILLNKAKDKDKLKKCGLYLNMYKEKWKRVVIKHEED